MNQPLNLPTPQVASGFSSVLVPIYLGELSPPILRGTFGTFTQFGTVIGILMSAILAFPLATSGGWRYLFGVTAVLAVLMLALSPRLLESPRWLLSNRHDVAAGEVLRALQVDRHADRQTIHQSGRHLVKSGSQAGRQAGRQPINALTLD